MYLRLLALCYDSYVCSYVIRFRTFIYSANDEKAGDIPQETSKLGRFWVCLATRRRGTLSGSMANSL